ncbi:DUF1177 domain-containing protein [Saxibacter everestensis]|uniref:DUF1177 domain-containing protein n=1 Tax=Saxibacter everestensis TaxID=2909229 RepID=A0ABY8QSX0_9MICO|nr:DUF1177 domain-containing protein [Brevibacteriaceae bacterium ZFBP1038]
MLNHVIAISDLLDNPSVDGHAVADHLAGLAGGTGIKPEVSTVTGDRGSTDFVKVVVPGTSGKTAGGAAPTLGVIGRLGGIGARPEIVGLVSDADGAVSALSVAAKLLVMAARGDRLAGDVIVATHVCPDAPTLPHEPVPFMDSPVDIATMNAYEVGDDMDAVLSIDTTKGNRVVNHRGIALSPTVKEGYILRVSEDLLSVLATVTGELPVTYPITIQDITPYGNGAHHLNSILQPATATTAPVVGLAITAASAVAGCATGASHEADIAAAARFGLETAKAFGDGTLHFHDQTEFRHLVSLYGSLAHFQTLGMQRSGKE